MTTPTIIINPSGERVRGSNLLYDRAVETGCRCQFISCFQLFVEMNQHNPEIGEDVRAGLSELLGQFRDKAAEAHAVVGSGEVGEAGDLEDLEEVRDLGDLGDLEDVEN